MKQPTTRVTPAIRAPRRGRLAPLAIAVAALALLVAACGGPAGPDTASEGPQVLGLYEIVFDDVGTEAMTASIRRIDDGLGTQAITGTSPQTGVSTSFTGSSGADTSAGVDPGGDRRYIWGDFEVTNNSGQDLTGLTFLGYSSAGNSLNGTAFRVAEDTTTPVPNQVDARSIYPGGLYATDGSRVVLDRHNVVAYSEDEIGTFETALRQTYPSFINTVFPYGFAATTTDVHTGGRTIADGGTGRLFIAFNAPNLNRVAWRAVAVVDDRVRTALPPVYNHRDGNGFDDFLADADSIATSTGQKVETVVLGTMVQDDRELPAAYDCTTFDYVELFDVRLAGGYGIGPEGTEGYWIGGSTENTTVDQVTDSAAACNP